MKKMCKYEVISSYLPWLDWRKSQHLSGTTVFVQNKRRTGRLRIQI